VEEVDWLRGFLAVQCNKEGFNAAGIKTGWCKARIGFLGNNENDCKVPDSRIGFGTGGKFDDSNTCGKRQCGHQIMGTNTSMP